MTLENEISIKNKFSSGLFMIYLGILYIALSFHDGDAFIGYFFSTIILFLVYFIVIHKHESQSINFLSEIQNGHQFFLSIKSRVSLMNKLTEKAYRKLVRRVTFIEKISFLKILKYISTTLCLSYLLIHCFLIYSKIFNDHYWLNLMGIYIFAIFTIQGFYFFHNSSISTKRTILIKYLFTYYENSANCIVNPHSLLKELQHHTNEKDLLYIFEDNYILLKKIALEEGDPQGN